MAIIGVDSGTAHGEVAEWSMATVLKTVVGLYPTVGSTPTLSAITITPSLREWSIVMDRNEGSRTE